MLKYLVIFCWSLASVHAATFYVDINNTTPQSPYNTWGRAATNIQEVVDAVAPFSQILVSSGIYALDVPLTISKSLTLESVSGAHSTTLKSSASARCLNLENHQTLVKGFTITGGKTSGYTNGDGYGGGVYCTGINPVIDSCIVSNNYASQTGGGMYKGTVRRSLICMNRTAISGDGGGLSFSFAENCTIVTNTAAHGAGASQCTLYNSIIFGNPSTRNLMGNPDENLRYGTTYHCCSPTLTDGENGNISVDPLLDSNWKLLSNSPCISAGVATVNTGGVDLDGDYWGSPPSMGFDELPEAPLFQFNGPTHLISGRDGNFEFWGLTDPVVDLGNGQTISSTNRFTAAWMSDGVYEIVISGHNSAIPATLTFTQTLHVVSVEDSTIYVAPGGDDSNDGSNWGNAKASIQEAVYAQEFTHGRVWVSNGVYRLSSEIHINKALEVVSLNGAEETIVDGGGSNSVFYLEHPESMLAGLTVTNGFAVNGGGIRCDSLGPVITNCIVVGNSADNGGGVYKGTVRNSRISKNWAGYGGGVNSSRVLGSVVSFNKAHKAGGAYESEIIHCNIIGNSIDGRWASDGAGADDCTVRNSIVYYNNYSTNYVDINTWSKVYNSCASDEKHGRDGNITNAPALLDAGHLLSSSLCIASADRSYSEGVDIDGEEWGFPPSMGCDEPYGTNDPGTEPYIPPLMVTLNTQASQGTIIRSPDQADYQKGSAVSLTAVPDSGFIFSGWSGDADDFDNPRDILMDKDKTMTANFKTAFDGSAVEAGQLDWAASTANNGLGGTVAWSVQSTDFVAGGSALQTPAMTRFENIYIEAYVAGPAVVKFGWKVGGTRPGRMVCSVDGINQTSVSFGFGWTEDIVTIPAGRHRVRWQTETLTTLDSMGSAYLDNVQVISGDFVSLSLNQDKNGTIASSPSTNVFTHGETVSVEAVPNPGYEFIDWNGAYAGLSNPMTLTMDTGHRISATFYRVLDGDAVGLPFTKWYTGGVGEWIVNETDGGFVNGAVNGRGGTWIETSIVGPCELSFDLKFEPNREGLDILYAIQDDVRTEAPSSFDWTSYSMSFPGGIHTFRIAFANFVDINALNNRNAFIRNVVILGSEWLAEAQPMGGSAYWSPYFGEFWRDETSSLILNADRGWQYLHPDDTALVYDFRLAKWLLFDRATLPFARSAEAPARWFLHDGQGVGTETFANPPVELPDPADVVIANLPFPSTAFITATSSGERVFSLWNNPSNYYEFLFSSNLQHWETFGGEVHVDGTVNVIHLDEMAATNAFIRARITPR